MTFIFHTIIEVLKGVPHTLAVTLIAMCVGILIGSIFALIRLHRIPGLSQFVVIYNSFLEVHP